MEAKLFDSHPELFNHYIASHPAGDLLQTTYWGELKAHTGWEALPLAVSANGQIQASALILKRRLPLPGKCIFYSPRGPLFSSPEALDFLLEAGRELGKAHGALLWKMDPALKKDDPVWADTARRLKQIDTGLDFNNVQPKFIMELDIRPSLDTILKNMKSKTRYNIGYAERRGVTVHLSRVKSDLELFYPLLQETAVRDNFKIRSFEYFENLWDALVVPRTAQLFLAFHDNQPLGGAIAFCLGRRAWYVYGASSNTKRNLQASYALQWAMIRWAKGLGCTTYDFRGVSGDLNPDNPLYGLYRFKEGFGAQLVEYVGEFDLPLSPLYTLWNPAVRIYNQLTGKNNS
ncbi:MAG: lipid II:glycine glycyltransferase FemX [Candidatus Wallacebacter cryptica]|jgi:peptidoglycan pentaglycine glycine transferase (the first glycine)|nr:peptidoglycan bridge formation glycyltransferase FemA/FemB family protein [Bacillota bacterium]